MPDFAEQLRLARSMTSAELRAIPVWIAGRCVLRERKGRDCFDVAVTVCGEKTWARIKPLMIAKRTKDEARDWLLGR